MMGKTKLIWSPIQLRLVNKHKIVPIGSLLWVNVNIDGVRNIVDFELIEIVDGGKPYPKLVGLDLDFDNQTLIDLKKRHIVFEVRDWKVIAPLDPIEGRRYVEPMKGKDLDNLYNVTTHMDDYVNPTSYGALIWRIITSCASNSEDYMKY
jgi:hypothetical protein